MSHGVAVTAYKDFPTLRRLVQQLTAYGFFVAVHVDKKSEYSPGDINEISSLGAHVISKYRVEWGSYSHLLAIIELLEILLAKQDLRYVHTVSGQDLVVANKSRFLEICDGRIFLNVDEPDDLPDYITSRYTGRDWFWMIEGAPGHRMLSSFSRRLQWKIPSLHSNRIGPFARIYKGLVWATMPAQICAEAISTSRHNGFLRDLRSVTLPEEFFFQTLIMNSPHANLVENSSLRFMEWKGGGPSPAYLDESCVPALLRSETLFARKVHSEKSGRLLEVLSVDNTENQAAEYNLLSKKV